MRQNIMFLLFAVTLTISSPTLLALADHQNHEPKTEPSFLGHDGKFFWPGGPSEKCLESIHRVLRKCFGPPPSTTDPLIPPLPFSHACCKALQVAKKRCLKHEIYGFNIPSFPFLDSFCGRVSSPRHGGKACPPPPPSSIGGVSPPFSPPTPGFGGVSPALSPSSPGSRGVSPTLSPFSPGFGGVSPTFSPSSPGFGGVSPTFSPSSPGFGAASPTLSPSSPDFGDVSPTLSPSSPSFGGLSPTLPPSSPGWGGVSPTLSPSNPGFGGVSPTLSPSSPVLEGVSPTSSPTTSSSEGNPPKIGIPPILSNPPTSRFIHKEVLESFHHIIQRI